MANIKPPVALHAAWIVGLICTILGGRTGMVNGAEGAFAAIIQTMVKEPECPGGNGEGIELLFPSVMCAGAISTRAARFEPSRSDSIRLTV